MDKFRVFISSVQKELENERVAAGEILWTDPFLKTHCEPILYEFEPASPKDATKECLDEVDLCQVYVLIVGHDYGYKVNDLSITHLEYRRAKDRALPRLVFIKGTDDSRRDNDVRRKLLKEVREDKVKYKRFENYRDLQRELRAALVKLLKTSFGVEPTTDEDEIADSTIETASNFGKQRTSLTWAALDTKLVKTFVMRAESLKSRRIAKDKLQASLISRALLRYDADHDEFFASAAGVLLLAKDPAAVFPQCRILADAFHGEEKSSRPDDQADIRSPIPLAIDEAIEFVQRNTRHPMRVVGLNRVRLDEYPLEALREALVNAVAHRRYEQDGQKILLNVFSDRVVVASPGMLPKPLTLASVRKGRYHPCSRNPLVAQGLSFFHRIEERGSGFGRMKDEMLNHGLDPPTYGTRSGYFEVTFHGPKEDLDRLRVPAATVGQLVKPSVESQLNDRQKQMVALLLKGEALTSRRCEELFGVARPTATSDFNLLLKLKLANREGRGRSTRYVWRGNENR